MRKSFKQELEGLEAGLRQLENLKKNAKTFRDHEKVRQNMEIQKARIQFFKSGYNLAKKEFKSQTTLK